MEDSRIVALYWARDEEAIRATASKYGSYCRSIADNILRSREDAEECVGDTWFRAWGLMPDKRPGILSSFLGGITRSMALDRYRSQHGQKRGGGETALALEELAECVPGGAEPARVYEQKELAEAIGRVAAAHLAASGITPLETEDTMTIAEAVQDVIAYERRQAKR